MAHWQTFPIPNTKDSNPRSSKSSTLLLNPLSTVTVQARSPSSHPPVLPRVKYGKYSYHLSPFPESPPHMHLLFLDTPHNLADNTPILSHYASARTKNRSAGMITHLVLELNIRINISAVLPSQPACTLYTNTDASINTTQLTSSGKQLARARPPNPITPSYALSKLALVELCIAAYLSEAETYQKLSCPCGNCAEKAIMPGKKGGRAKR